MLSENPSSQAATASGQPQDPAPILHPAWRHPSTITVPTLENTVIHPRAAGNNQCASPRPLESDVEDLDTASESDESHTPVALKRRAHWSLRKHLSPLPRSSRMSSPHSSALSDREGFVSRKRPISEIQEGTDHQTPCARQAKKTQILAQTSFESYMRVMTQPYLERYENIISDRKSSLDAKDNVIDDLISVQRGEEEEFCRYQIDQLQEFREQQRDDLHEFRRKQDKELEEKMTSWET